MDLKGFVKHCRHAGFFLCFFLWFSVMLQAQVPAYIPYQAIARDPAGQVKANVAINVQFKVFNTMTATSAAYEEVHATTTNDFGYFNLRIGNGSPQAGTFSSITWSTGNVSYEIWIDAGSGFTQLGGRSGFLSVPYALYAANAAPAATISINAPNTVTNTSTGNYTINVPPPALSISGNSLSISNGNTVTIPSGITYSAGPGISLNAAGMISNTAPNQTVSVSGSGVSGAYPSYTVTAPPTYSAGPGISINAGVISNTSPDETVNITGSGVSGAYPSYTVVAQPAVSISGTGVSGAYPNYTVTAPAAYSAGPGISISSGVISNTASNQTVSISGSAVSGTYPNYTVTASPITTVSSGNSNIIVSGTAPAYTLSAVTPTLTGVGNAVISGTYPNQSVIVDPQVLSLSNGTLSLSNGGNSVVLPVTSITSGGVANVTNNGSQYQVSVPGPGLSYSGATGTFTYSQSAYTNTINLSPQVAYNNGTLSVGSNSVTIPVWGLTGNAGTGASSDYLGTSDASDLVIKTNNSERLRVTSTGSVGIGNASPAANLDVNGSVKLGTLSNVFSTVKYGTASGSIALSIINADVNTTISVPGAQPGDMIVMTLNSYSGTSATLSINYAAVTSANTVTASIHSSSLISLLVTANFSYIILRP